MTKEQKEELEKRIRNVIYEYGLNKARDPLETAEKERALTAYMAITYCTYEQVMKITQCVRDSVELLRQEEELARKRIKILIETMQLFNE